MALVCRFYPAYTLETAAKLTLREVGALMDALNPDDDEDDD